MFRLSSRFNRQILACTISSNARYFNAVDIARKFTNLSVKYGYNTINKNINYNSQSHFSTTIPKLGKLQPFLLADIGEGITECEVIQWFINDGDRVSQFQKICEVQSDKAAVEITSRYDGIIRKLHYEKGDIAKVGRPLVDIELDGPGSGTETVEAVGSPSVKESSKAKPVSTPISNDNHANNSKVLTTPAVRRIAKENNVDLSLVKATGPQGRILKGDVLEYIENGAVIISKTEESPISVSYKHSIYEEDKIISLSPIQKAMFKTMTGSLSIPHLGYSEEIILNSTSQFRKSINDYLKINKSELSNIGLTKITYMPIFIKAFSEALKKYPILNAQVVDSSPTEPLNVAKKSIKLRANHNIGFAMDTPQGLLVPNIKRVQDLSILEIAKKMEEIKQNVIDTGSIKPADLSGGTFTLSNIGNIGGTVLHPVLVPTEVCIVALGRVQNLPRYNEKDELFKAEVLNASLNADHRIIDGATVARFISEWKTILENPALLSLNLR